MESSIAVFLMRWSACELPPTGPTSVHDDAVLLVFMVTAGPDDDCRCWLLCLLLLVAAGPDVYCCLWLGCCCWLLLLMTAAADGCQS